MRERLGSLLISAVEGFLEMFTTSFVIVSVEYLAVKHPKSSPFQSLATTVPCPNHDRHVRSDPHCLTRPGILVHSPRNALLPLRRVLISIFVGQQVECEVIEVGDVKYGVGESSESAAS